MSLWFTLMSHKNIKLPVGYNMVAHIPRGACNLNITQIRKSPNYLGKFFLSTSVVFSSREYLCIMVNYKKCLLVVKYL